MKGSKGSRLPVDQALAMTIEGEDAVLFRNVFPKTPSGKVELESTYLAEKYDARLPRYRPYRDKHPLILISPASDRRITSTFGGAASSDGPPPLEMNPIDAGSRGLANGVTVRVWNELGEIRFSLRITDAVPPGVVSTTKGAWLRTSDNGQTVTALVPGHHADLARGACFNDTRVEVALLD